MFFFSHLRRGHKVRIAMAIAIAEQGSSGEIRVHLSYAKNELDILKSTEAKFKELKMDQTKLRNGVLLYINPRIKKFAIFGDEGVHACVQQNFWDELAKNVSAKIQEKNVVHGIEHAVEVIGNALKEHFPHETDGKNQLDNDVTESE
jgi:uncharacterized membrane protein